MKKIKAFTLALLFISFAVLFSGCSKGIPAIDMPTYFKDSVTSNVYKSTSYTNKTLSLSQFTNSNPDTTKMDKYLDFSFTANSDWIYKMYIEKIEFYVITSETPLTEMTFTFNISNLAKENNITEENNIKNETISINPTANSPYKIILPVDRVVRTASSTTTITIDISESSELLLNKNNTNNSFKWMIYGLTVFGESREYSR